MLALNIINFVAEFCCLKAAKYSCSINPHNPRTTSISEAIPETFKILTKFRTYLLIRTLIHILWCLSSTTCTSERYFSSLTNLKSYLQSIMKEGRLNGMAALHIHEDMRLNVDRIISEFGKQNIKLKFN